MRNRIQISINEKPSVTRMSFHEMKESGTATLYKIHNKEAGIYEFGRMLRVENSFSISCIFLREDGAICAENPIWSDGWHHARYAYEPTEESIKISIF